MFLDYFTRNLLRRVNIYFVSSAARFLLVCVCGVKWTYS